MKAIHFIVYILVNLLFVFVISYLNLNTYVEASLISIINILILFFIQKMTISEVQQMANRIINVGEENVNNSKDVYIAGFDDLREHFNEINIKMKDFSKENQKSLTVSLEAVLNSTLDGIIVINNNRDIIMANDSFFRLCGYRAYEISGKDSTTMVSPENILSKNLIRFIKYSFENTQGNINNISTGIIEINHIKPNHTLKATATPLKYNSETLDGLVINLKDITKELEANEEKNKFVAGISHEFRTPLFSIMGYASLLNEDEDLDKKSIKDFGKTIFDESLRLSDIIDNLLNVLTLNKDQTNVIIEKINYKDILSSVINEYENKVKLANLKVITKFDDNNFDLLNNKENLSTIFSNLISNCIKFSDKGKEIEIITKFENNNLKVSFSNYGELIPESSKEKIFEKFYRVEDSVHKVPGAGLGLFISKRIAKSHGGDITFESKADGNTIFSLELPIRSKYDKQDFNSINLQKQKV